MLDFINKVFGAPGEPDSTDSKQVQAHDIRIATCALFLEMAQIDGEFDENERKKILNQLKINVKPFSKQKLLWELR